jgi:hypothetical protein
MKPQVSAKLYFAFGALYLLYNIFSFDTTRPHYEEPAITTGILTDSSRRVLVSRMNSCSGDDCSILYFLSGIFDIVSMDLRFVQPREQEDFETVFTHASFAEAAYAHVTPFSEIEFYLSSQTSESSASNSNIGGSYAFSDVTNGSAIIVASEYPGREVWMFSDRSVTATCSGSRNSAVIFGNALNDGSHLFTKDPEGVCHKLEMDYSKSSTPLTYCQLQDNFTWNVYMDYSCSSHIITAETVSGSLGTVYCVVVGQNLTTADIVCLSSESGLFEDVREIKEPSNDAPPLYLRTYMQIIGGSTAGSIVALVLVLYACHLLNAPVIKFREGDIVVYKLTTAQQFYLHQKKKEKSPTAPSRVKNKGFAIVIRAAPPASVPSRVAAVFSMERWSWGRRKNTMKKGILQLQPLKRVIRNVDTIDKKGKDDLFSSSLASANSDINSTTVATPKKLKSLNSLVEVEEMELTVDAKERPLSTNWWGIRGGKVIAVFANTTRRKIRLPAPVPVPPPPPVPVSGSISSDPAPIVARDATQRAPRPKRELGILTYLDNISTQKLLSPVRQEIRRRRRVPNSDIDEEAAEGNPKTDDDTKKNQKQHWLCVQRLCGSNASSSREVREVKRSTSRGIGWGGEEDMFLLYDNDSFDPEPEDEEPEEEEPSEDQSMLQPFLRRISRSKSLVGRKTSVEASDSSHGSAVVVLQEAYSYVLTDLPPVIGGEKFNRIYYRDWVYPFAQEEKQAEAKRNNKRRLWRDQKQSMQQHGLLQDPNMETIKSEDALDEVNGILNRPTDSSPLSQAPGQEPSSATAAPSQPATTHFRERSSSRAETLLKQLQQQQVPAAGDSPDSGTSSRRISQAQAAFQRQYSSTSGAGYKSDMPRVSVRRRTGAMPAPTGPAAPDQQQQQQPVFTAPRRAQGSFAATPLSRSRLRPAKTESSRSRALRQQHSDDMSADADREVQVGPDTVGVVMAGSKLERDDDEEEEGVKRATSRGRQLRSRGAPRSLLSRGSSRGASGGDSGESRKKITAGADGVTSNPRSPRVATLPPVITPRQTESTPPRPSSTTKRSTDRSPSKSSDRKRSPRKKKSGERAVEDSTPLVTDEGLEKSSDTPDTRRKVKRSTSRSKDKKSSSSPREGGRSSGLEPIKQDHGATNVQLDLSFLGEE